RQFYPYFSISADAEVPHAHNTFLQMALDFGMPGLVAYAAMLSAAALMVLRAWRAESDTVRRALVLGLACGLIACQVFGLTDAVLFGTRPAFAWWLALGMLTGLAASPPMAPLRWRISGVECVLLWMAASLMAVGVLVDHALLGVVTAILGGFLFGAAAFVNFNARREQ
ncbi:MAG: hypothetical protein LC737_08265, partial [Chloroflexi bacterium]|nr:hypothetical protein [Chloroflexota bacterium]